MLWPELVGREAKRPLDVLILPGNNIQKVRFVRSDAAGEGDMARGLQIHHSEYEDVVIDNQVQ